MPNAPISVRVGTREDIGFIDALQKRYAKALGFFPRAQMEGYIDGGWVLIAEMNGSPVGYVASRDRYLKRDELGVIYQLCVSPGAQRGLIGASLIKAMFERSAYGCRLYCCWCAQDLAANRFWEALGFQAIAFRGGSAKKGRNGQPGRVHIFWQKRIRANDTGDVSRGGTPWWFPAKTEGGAIREDRLVLPIPPGTHWSEAMPVIVADETQKPERAKRTARVKAVPLPPTKVARASSRFGPPGVTPRATPIIAPTVEAPPLPAVMEKPKREKAKVDPKMIAAARELRDRYLEQVNADASPVATGKYDVSRAIEAKARTKRLAA